MTPIEQLQMYCPITGWLINERIYKKPKEPRYRPNAYHKEYYQKNKERIKIKRMQERKSNYYI